MLSWVDINGERETEIESEENASVLYSIGALDMLAGTEKLKYSGNVKQSHIL